MKNKDFAVFILTHGRPNKVKTYDLLIRSNYTGKIYIIIDDEDETADQYYNLFGNKVIMFNKESIAKTFDECDNFNDRRAIVYARNACFEIAKNLGITYFLQLDDDYTNFDFRLYHINPIPYRIKNIDIIFDLFLDYYKSIPAKSIALAQGGDYGGGKDNKDLLGNIGRKRKCMNSFFCSINRPFKFIGRINEDVNTYVNLGRCGNLFLTIPYCSLTQITTQSNPGGMRELYLMGGTFIKSFYTVMINPSSIKISTIGNIHARLHHNIDWRRTVPVIINEKYKKAEKINA